MTYSKNIAIVSSFLCLWLASLLTSTLETALGFILILSFGILHGSNDLLIFENLSIVKRKYSKLMLLCIYIGIVALVFILFSFLPLLALILFILFSAYHFGEQHWEHLNLNINTALKLLFYGSYGLFILFLLFILNKTAVIDIVETISNYRLEVSMLNGLFYCMCVVFATTSTYIGIRNKILLKNALSELLYLLVFSVIFKISSLIWGFAIYFIFWHSLPSLQDQINFIYKTFDKKSAWLYVKNAAPYWLISVAAVIIFYYAFNTLDIFYALFFSFLAAVTFPHSVTINTMFRRMNSE